MTPWFVLPGATVCALVLVACISRLNLMRIGHNRMSWLALYALWAPFAGGMLLDLLICPRKVDWWSCVGIGGVLLYVILTRDKWEAGAPAETELHS